MDAQQFISYVKEPRTLDKESLESIERLASEFPYCQSLRILHLLNLRMVNHVIYSEQLKTSAAYIADRRRLKELIRDLKEGSVTALPEEMALPEEEVIHKEDTGRVEVSQAHEVSIEHDAGIIGEALVDEASIREVPSDSEAVQYDSAEEEAPETEMKPEPIVPIIELDEEARLLALKEIVEKRLREINEEKETHKSQEQESKQALIDKFIREEPSISRPKAEFFDPVRVARSSQQEHEGIVSETLARIHLQQGNIAKAIEIYRKLSLNFPEKSSYFAAQIEKIKSEN